LSCNGGVESAEYAFFSQPKNRIAHKVQLPWVRHRDMIGAANVSAGRFREVLSTVGRGSTVFLQGSIKSICNPLKPHWDPIMRFQTGGITVVNAVAYSGQPQMVSTAVDYSRLTAGGDFDEVNKEMQADASKTAAQKEKEAAEKAAAHESAVAADAVLLAEAAEAAEQKDAAVDEEGAAAGPANPPKSLAKRQHDDDTDDDDDDDDDEVTAKKEPVGPPAADKPASKRAKKSSKK
jgi:hypothetical protein